MSTGHFSLRNVYSGSSNNGEQRRTFYLGATLRNCLVLKSSANPFVREDKEYYSEGRKILKIKSDKTKQACIFLKDFKAVDKTLLNL